MRILIAEDEPNAAELVRRLLTLSGLDICAFELVGTLEEAVDKVKSEPPDVLILDLRLKDTPASAAVMAIHELARLCPVVVMSGSQPAEYMAKCHAAGAMAYLHKQMFLRPGFEAFLQHAIVTARMNWKRDARRPGH